MAGKSLKMESQH